MAEGPASQSCVEASRNLQGTQLYASTQRKQQIILNICKLI